VKGFQSLLLPALARGRGLDEPILKLFQQLWIGFLKGGKQVERELAIVGTGFDQHGPGGGQLPQVTGELARQQFPEHWANGDAGKEITLPADRFTSVFIKAEAGRVKGQFHEPGEGNEPPAVCLLLNECGQRVVALDGVLVGG